MSRKSKSPALPRSSFSGDDDIVVDLTAGADDTIIASRAPGVRQLPPALLSSASSKAESKSPRPPQLKRGKLNATPSKPALSSSKSPRDSSETRTISLTATDRSAHASNSVLSPNSNPGAVNLNSARHVSTLSSARTVPTSGTRAQPDDELETQLQDALAHTEEQLRAVNARIAKAQQEKESLAEYRVETIDRLAQLRNRRDADSSGSAERWSAETFKWSQLVAETSRTIFGIKRQASVCPQLLAILFLVRRISSPLCPSLHNALFALTCL